MTVESNTPDTGTDNDAPQANDTAPEWDYYDPDEDQDTAETPEPDATDDGTAEADEAPETEEPNDEDETDTDEPPAEVEAPENSVVTMADGSKMKVDDLIKGHLRQSDYTRKAQEVATQRTKLESEVQRLEGITAAFVDHLTGLVPPPPSQDLLYRDRDAYFVQKESHDLAMAKVDELVKIGAAPKEIQSGLAKEDRDRRNAEENGKLAEMFPETARKDTREKFFTQVATVADEFGFSTDELRGIGDHRIFAALHYAALGKAAEAAKVKAKAKVADVPPVAPKRPGHGAVKANGNAGAMKRLGQTGLMRDALNVDFD